jgi:hypothetical protein
VNLIDHYTPDDVGVIPFNDYTVSNYVDYSSARFIQVYEISFVKLLNIYYASTIVLKISIEE